ncbi:MAG: hypothetical protein JWP74_528 [Marmoricola sp.]|nr:hypothetical protein [Marmoricola sp.]
MDNSPADGVLLEPRKLADQKEANVLLRTLATIRESSGAQPTVRYDETQKMSYVQEGGAWVPSFESHAFSGTKKADLETGEDQKGQ